MNDVRWASVHGCAAYKVSDSGQIVRVAPQRGAKVGRILKARQGAQGYLYANIGGQSRTVHRIVLESFHGTGSGRECCHVNGNKTDNRLSNLRWGSKAENYADRVEHGGGNHGERHGRAQLTERAVLSIRASTLPAAQEAKLHGVSRSCVQMIRKGKRLSGFECGNG